MPRYSDDQLHEAAENSTSITGVLRFLGILLPGGSHGHIRRRMQRAGVDTSHFTGRAWNKGKKQPRRTAASILVKRDVGDRQGAAYLRRALIESGVTHLCEQCGLGPEWKGKPLVLDVDHRNRNRLDDRKKNLRFLCPNCHSQA